MAQAEPTAPAPAPFQAPAFVQLEVDRSHAAAPILLKRRGPPPKTPPGKEAILRHWAQERRRANLPLLTQNFWCQRRAEILACERAIRYFEERRRQAAAMGQRDDDAEWACAHFPAQLHRLRPGSSGSPPSGAKVQEIEIPVLAEWPGPPWLVTDIGIELVAPGVGIEAIVVMATRPGQRY